MQNLQLTHHADQAQIPNGFTPGTFRRLANNLNLKIDQTSWKLLSELSEHHDNLPLESPPVTPVIFKINASYRLKSFELSDDILSGGIESYGWIMARGQASAYLRSEILSPQCKGPCTIWIPFTDGPTNRKRHVQFVIRIYRRADGSTEVFFYDLFDKSEWDHEQLGNYFVALDKKTA